MPHYQRNIRFIFFLILPILGFLLGWSLSQKNAATESETQISEVAESMDEANSRSVLKSKPALFRKTDPKDVNLDIFWEVWHLMEGNYLNPENLETKEQVYGATKGLVDSLDDPYSVFMTPDEMAEFEESMSGEFQGIGAEIDKRDNQIVVVSPLKGSPAESAGLKTRDIIFKVNDEPTFGMSIEEVVTKIRGPKGEKVVLTIIRKEERKPIEISIVRDNIILPTLEWKMEDGDIAHVAMYQFGNNAVKDFKKAVPEILLKSPKGIIMDFRGNGGGLLDACIKILSEFIDNQVVVKTKGRKFGDTGDLVSARDGAFLDVPLVVLVNEGSASASEIFAGAIQDHERGVILGRKTFGKGSVQNVIPLSNGSSLKVTVAEWLTPDGRSIHKNGITPDEIVEDEVDPETEFDPMLERALQLIGTEEALELIAQESEAIEEDTGEVAEKVENSENNDNTEDPEQTTDKTSDEDTQ